MNNNFNISASFNIPYYGWSQFDGKTLKNIYYSSCPEVKRDINRDIMVQNELARMDFVEDQLQEMTEYPDAMAIIEKVRNGL